MKIIVNGIMPVWKSMKGLKRGSGIVCIVTIDIITGNLFAAHRQEGLEFYALPDERIVDTYWSQPDMEIFADDISSALEKEDCIKEIKIAPQVEYELG